MLAVNPNGVAHEAPPGWRFAYLNGLEAEMDPDVAVALGAKIRSMRKLRGESLREQARQVGMSPSALSELERGVSGASLQRLQAVALHLGTTISDLLAAAGDSPESEQLVRDLELFASTPEDGSVIERSSGVHYSVMGEGTGHSLQPYSISFGPGSGYPHDPISHKGEEFMFVLMGKVILYLGGHEHLLEAGESTRFNSDIPHAFGNACKKSVASIIGAATPPW